MNLTLIYNYSNKSPILFVTDVKLFKRRKVMRRSFYPVAIFIFLSLFLSFTAFCEQRIIRIPDKSTITTIAGCAKMGLVDGAGETARFNVPIRLAVDHSGNVLVSDIFNNSIRLIDNNGIVKTLAGNIEGGYIDGPAKDSRFGTPHGVAVDSKGIIYATDLLSSTIRKITPDGIVSTFAGAGTPGYKDGKGKEAMLNNPHAIAIDSGDNLFIADIGNNLIRKITPEGVVSTVAGNLKAGYRDGKALEAQFNMPIDIALDADENIIVCDIKNSRIRKISNGAVTTIAGNGNKGYRDGPLSEAEFGGPHGIAIDDRGIIYIAELYNNVIRCIKPDGKVYTVAGSGGKGDLDGDENTAQMNEPGGLAIDRKTGTIYIADLYNHKVKKLVFTK